jgi:hypothetical protein|tara:strand:- start:314 stop:505 length:192 start_codon:yes stop_codon:yes gene_type:complete
MSEIKDKLNISHKGMPSDITYSGYARNAWLYQYLLSMGLVATPIFKKDSSDIEYIHVSAAARC